MLSDGPMEYIASLFLAALGAAGILAGYRLFCDLPVMRGSRAAVILLNMLPGALLASSGTALLTVEARAMFSHRPAMRRDAPPAEGTSWHPPSPQPVGHAA